MSLGMIGDEKVTLAICYLDSGGADGIRPCTPLRGLSAAKGDAILMPDRVKPIACPIAGCGCTVPRQLSGSRRAPTDRLSVFVQITHCQSDAHPPPGVAQCRAGENTRFCARSVRIRLSGTLRAAFAVSPTLSHSWKQAADVQTERDPDISDSGVPTGICGRHNRRAPPIVIAADDGKPSEANDARPPGRRAGDRHRTE